MELTGTIVEIEPMDGLGWIELESGERVRFGGTACKGFVPSIGLRVAVQETAQGYGGATKAVLLRSLEAKPASPADSAPSAPRPRSAVSGIDSYEIAIDAQLRAVLARWDTDDTFNIDLETMMFELEPFLAEVLDCHNPWFFVIAMNGGGSAYGLYLHPTAPSEGGPPWVFWQHEDDTLYYVAPNAEQFFGAFLRNASGWIQDQEPITRSRQAFADLGLDCPKDGPPLKEDGAVWLPPQDVELLSVDEYLAMMASKPEQAECGLLAHSSRRDDARARGVLESLYSERGWSPPGNRRG